MAKNKAAAVVAAVMTVAVTVLRIVLIPKLTLPESGWFRWSYLAIILLAATVAAVFALGRFPKGEERRSIAGKPMLATAVAGMLCGSLLAVLAIFDAGNWLFYEKTPPPNEEVISRLDAIALALLLLVGLLAGIALIRCWFIWIGAGRTRPGILRVWALAPTLWAWLRLARYEMSYASAVDFSRNFYDFMMMVFELLFFFALARYISGVGTKPPRSLPCWALCTGVFSLSGPAVQLAMRLSGEDVRYTAGSMATVMDFVIGAFAMILAFALIGKGRPDPAQGDEAAEAARSMPGAEKWEEIVGELTGPDASSVSQAEPDTVKGVEDVSEARQETENG